MLTLRAYLWKEWQDHRGPVLGFVALLPLVCGLLVFVLPNAYVMGADFVSYVTAGSLLLALVAIAAELIPGELQRRTFTFLERLPGDLRLAFWGKIVFLSLLIVAFGVWGFVASSAYRWLLAPEVLHADVGTLLGLWLLVLVALTLGFWAVAVSCWVPRSVLAIPAALLFFAMLALPCYWMLRANPGLQGILLQEDRMMLLTALHLLPIVALVAARLSLHGRRCGRGPLDAARRGLVWTVLATVPIWAFGGERVVDWRSPDLQSTGFRITGGYLGQDARYAFVNTMKRERWAAHALIVDLQTGDWQQIGGPQNMFVEAGLLDGHTPYPFAPHPLVLQMDPHQHVTYRDGATGEQVGEGPLQLPYPDLAVEANASKRAMTPYRLPDGRRVWLYKRRLMVDKLEGGAEEMPWDSRDEGHSSVGFGLKIFLPEGGFVIYDFTRARRFDRWKWGNPHVWVLPRWWLVADRARSGPSRAVSWRLLDPDQGAERKAMGLYDGDDVVAVHDDGRVFVIAGDAKRWHPDRIFLVHPLTGERQRIRFADGRQLPADNPGFGDAGYAAPVRTPGGARLFTFRIHGQPRQLVRFDDKTQTFTQPMAIGKLLGCVDDRWVMIITPDEKRLEKVDLETGRRVLVFPRPEP